MGRIAYENAVVYAGGKPVAGPATFEANPGELVMLVGPNGSGKTSLLKAAVGLAESVEGVVRVEGTPAYVPQGDMLLPWLTLAENIALPLMVRGVPRDKALAEAERIASRLGLSEHLTKLPREASGGTRRKAAVARGLIQGADVLLLDEPFTGVDAAGVGVLLGMLSSLKNQDMALVVVTHQVHAVAAVADAAVALLPPPRGVVARLSLRSLSPGERYEAAERLVSLVAEGGLSERPGS